MIKNVVLFLKVFSNVFFIQRKQQAPDKNLTLYLLYLSCAKAGRNYKRKIMMGHLRTMGASISERKVGYALKKICPSTQVNVAHKLGDYLILKSIKQTILGITCLYIRI